MNKLDVFNPTPISKMLVTLVLSFGITGFINEIFKLSIVILFALFFALNARAKTAIRVCIFYVIIILGIKTMANLGNHSIANHIFIILPVIKIMFLPILAAKFLIDTSDVSSLIVSFEKLKFPKVVVIPLAVMFRYFPAFREDRKNITRAMKMRGISFKNPIKYLEYVSVPILISATNIANDISKSAETKCISYPCQKTRYIEVKFGLVDFIYIFGVTGLYILGRIYA